MNNVGRPEFEITPHVLAEAERLASRGCSMLAIAQGLGISQATFGVKKKEFLSLQEAIDRGKAKALKTVEDSLFRNATEMSIDGKTGNASGTPGGDIRAQEFFLKRRGGKEWREPETTQNLNIQSQVKVSFFLPDNARRIIEQPKPAIEAAVTEPD